LFPAGFYPSGVWALFILFTFSYLVIYIKYPRFRVVRWRTIFGLYYAANFLDSYSTWLIADRFGFEYEQNQGVLSLMYAGWHYFALVKLVFLPAIAAVSLIVIYRYVKPAIALFLGTTATLFIAGINNIVLYIRLLLNS